MTETPDPTAAGAPEPTPVPGPDIAATARDQPATAMQEVAPLAHQLKQAVGAAVRTELGARLGDEEGRSGVVEQIRSYVRLVAAPRRVPEPPGPTPGLDQPEAGTGGEPSPAVGEPDGTRLPGLVDYRVPPVADADDMARGCAQIVDGRTPVRLGGIDWRVLEVRDHQALVLADRVIGTGPYNEASGDTTWESCDLRRWLNGPFLDSLGDAFGARVLSTQVKNEPNPVWGTEGGADTEDRVFLLSMQEVVWYLAREKNIDWKRYRSAKWFKGEKFSAVDVRGDSAWWWLRSPGYGAAGAAGVNDGGDFDDSGVGVSWPSGGVRPALWLNLESTAP